MLQGIYKWLAIGEQPRPADLIFVLAGRQYRKEFGLRLFANRWSRVLVLSVSRFEIRSFSDLNLPVPIDLRSLAAAIEPTYRQYFVTIEGGLGKAEKIRVGRLGTWTEIQALRTCLQNRTDIRSVLIVSSGFHLRRVRMCCRALLPESLTLQFVAAPDPDQEFDAARWWRHARTRRWVVAELCKLMAYTLLTARTTAYLRRNMV